MHSLQPLTFDTFSDQHWNPYTDFRHTANQTSLPVVSQEISHIAAELPLVLQLNQDTRQFELRVLVGLGRKGNACLNEQHQWRLTYLPSYLRSHPFYLKELSQLETGQKALCVDVSSPWVNQDHSTQPQAFFSDQGGNEKGRLAPKVQEIFDYLSEMETTQPLLEKAIQSLVQNLLLAKLDYTSHDGSILENCFTVKEDALADLTADRWLKLREQGGVTLIYAMIISQHNLKKLDTLERIKNPAPTKNIENGTSLDINNIFTKPEDDLFSF